MLEPLELRSNVELHCEPVDFSSNTAELPAESVVMS